MHQFSTSSGGLVTVEVRASDAKVYEMLARAAAVVAAYTEGDGRCAGCLDRWGRLVPYPFAQARWARAPPAVPGSRSHIVSH